MRYRDVAKFVIWPECTLPKEYNRGYVVRSYFHSYNEDKSKRTAIRYTHAGNHQSAVLRLNKASPKWSDTEVRKKLLSGELDTSAFIHPAGLKQDRSKVCVVL
ncbi:unnamed protein product [Anisakis simplex]|uniref:Transposase n=1 Tax=Anisakis simplex TaxID=6269 RepID=A0A0M3JB58_ANISI|nr:unnamed protein product [Anisakis simplex]VDK76542.1 unnamed protein product [Anisakis simplex]